MAKSCTMSKTKYGQRSKQGHPGANHLSSILNLPDLCNGFEPRPHCWGGKGTGAGAFGLKEGRSGVERGIVTESPGCKLLRFRFGLAAPKALMGMPYIMAMVAALSPGPRTYTFGGGAWLGVGAVSGGSSPPVATVLAVS